MRSRQLDLRLNKSLASTIQMSSHYTRVGVEKVREALKRLA